MSSASINSKLEFTICKEVASIGVTAGELIAIHQTIVREIGSPVFLGRMEQIREHLLACYRIPLEALHPLLDLDTPERFAQQFDAVVAHYRENYLQYASRPRRFVDQAYEQYLELSMSREASTSYPLLKRTFDRFFQYIDKWINNDSWLIMSMDTLFKMMQRFLAEIVEMKAKDVDDAWWIYQGMLTNLRPFIAIVSDHCDMLAQLELAAGLKEGGAAA